MVASFIDDPLLVRRTIKRCDGKSREKIEDAEPTNRASAY